MKNQGGGRKAEKAESEGPEKNFSQMKKGGWVETVTTATEKNLSGTPKQKVGDSKRRKV